MVLSRAGPRYATSKLVALAAGALVVELTVLDMLSVRGMRGETTLVLACFAVLFARDGRQGVAAAWAMGLLKDIASAGPLGLYALLFAVAGAGVVRGRRLLFVQAPTTQALVAFAFACGVNGAMGLWVACMAGGLSWAALAEKTLLSAALTAAPAPLLLQLLARRPRWVG